MNQEFAPPTRLELTNTFLMTLGHAAGIAPEGCADLEPEQRYAVFETARSVLEASPPQVAEEREEHLTALAVVEALAEGRRIQAVLSKRGVSVPTEELSTTVQRSAEKVYGLLTTRLAKAAARQTVMREASKLPAPKTETKPSTRRLPPTPRAAVQWPTPAKTPAKQPAKAAATQVQSANPATPETGAQKPSAPSATSASKVSKESEPTEPTTKTKLASVLGTRSASPRQPMKRQRAGARKDHHWGWWEIVNPAQLPAEQAAQVYEIVERGTANLPSGQPDPENWYRWALCKGSDTEFFFDRNRSNAARAVCGFCPVRLDCLAEAIDHDERLGIWGGMSVNNRGRAKARIERNEAENPTSKPQKSTQDE